MTPNTCVLLVIGLLIFLLVLYLIKTRNKRCENYTPSLEEGVSFDYSSDCSTLPAGVCDYTTTLSPMGEYELQWTAPDVLPPAGYQYGVTVTDASGGVTVQSITTPQTSFVLNPDTYVDSRPYNATVQTLYDGLKSTPITTSFSPYYPAYITSIVSQGRTNPLIGSDLVMRWIPYRFINTFTDSNNYPLLEDGSGWVLRDSKGTQIDSGTFGPEWPTNFAKTTHIPSQYAGQTLNLALTVISGNNQIIRPPGTSYFSIVVPQPNPNPPTDLSYKYVQT